MSSQYTDEVKKLIHTIKPPYPGLILDVVEYEDYLALRVYRPNIEEFSEPQKVALAEHLYRLRDAVRATGAKCHLEGVEDDPASVSVRRVRRREGG